MKAQHKKRSYPCLRCRVAALFLLFALLLSLCGCAEEPPIVTEGLTVAPAEGVAAAQIPEEEIAACREVLSLLLQQIVTEAGGAPSSSATAMLVGNYANAITDILAASGITALRFGEVVDTLSTKGAAAIDAYLSGKVQEGALSAFYLALSEQMGASRLGRVCYEIAVFRYTELAEAARGRYETYGYPHLLVKLEQLESELGILQNEIGEENFTVAMQLFMMLSDLAAYGVGQEEALSAFSAAEILIFLKKVPFDEISVSAQGWELLLSLAAAMIPDGCRAQQAAKADKNGDLALLAAEMEGLLSLAAAARDRLTEAEVALLQAGDMGGVLTAVFAAFTEEELAAFEAATSLPLDNAAYEEIAAACYGVPFLAYRDACAKLSFAELRATVGTSAFPATLAAYLRGISPALTYRGEG